MRLTRPSFRRSALLLAALAALHGLAYIPLVDTNEKTDTWSYVASANALLDGSYSTPLQAGFYFVYPDSWFDITGARIGESAWDEPERQVFRPPGYPAYLALFGKDKVFRGDHTAPLIGQALLFGLGAFLLMLTVRRWWGESVALLGGLLYALDPWSKHYVALVLSETLAGTLALALLYVFTRAWERPSWPRWLGAGALAAALSLARAVFVFAPALLVLAALVRSGSTRQRLTRAAATAAASAVLIVPWLAWTHSVVGRATMSVWGEGYNLVLAASGEGQGTTAGDVEADPAFQARHGPHPGAGPERRGDRGRPGRAPDVPVERGRAGARRCVRAVPRASRRRAARRALGRRVPHVVPLERTRRLVPTHRGSADPVPSARCGAHLARVGRRGDRGRARRSRSGGRRVPRGLHAR